MSEHTDDTTEQTEAALVERVRALDAENERLREELAADTDRLRERLSTLRRVLDDVVGDTPPDVDTAQQTTADGGPIHFDGGQNDYKVLGSLSVKNGGIGVLGRNTATNGITYGVKGETADSQGFGLYTPDDMKVDGAINGNLTGNTPIDNLLGTGVSVENGRLAAGSPPLPPLSTFNTPSGDPTQVDRALDGAFGLARWTEPTYADGPTYGGNGDSFRGAVRTPGGKVVAVPFNSSTVGVFRPQSGTFTVSDTHSGASSAFWGGTLAPTGEVIFAPHGSNEVGIYDPVTESYTSGPTHGEGNNAFAGAVALGSGKVVFVPYDAGNVGIFDPFNRTYSTGTGVTDLPTVGGSGLFAGGALTRNGDVMFAPFDAANVVLYDPSLGKVTTEPEHSQGSGAFAGATAVPDGRVVLTPFGASAVGIISADGSTFSTVTHGESTPAFLGGTLAPTGEVVFAPFAAANVGIFDPTDDTYSSGPSHGRSSSQFTGAALAPGGDVVCTPENNETLGIVHVPSGLDTHPLFNSS